MGHMTMSALAHRLGGRALSLALLLVAGVLIAPGAAGAATPALSVSVTHSPTAIPRSDQLITYATTVTNTADATIHAGDALTCSAGTWTGSPTFRYQWLRDSAAISDATASTYPAQAPDEGHSIQCEVFATNTGASASAVSAPLVVAPAPPTAPPAPTNPFAATARPTITGSTATAGSTQTCTAPTGWAGAPSWTFEWLVNGAPASGTATQTSATTSTYVVAVGDPPGVLQCEAIATNPGGSAVGMSNNKNTSPAPSPAAPSNSVTKAPFLAGPAATSAPVGLQLELPPGMRVMSVAGTGWSTGSGACSSQQPTSTQPAVVTCTRPDVLQPGASYPTLTVAASVESGTPDSVTAVATASGGGASQSASGQDMFSFGPAVPFGIVPGSFTTSVVDAAGNDYTQAGGHPFSASASFAFNTHVNPSGQKVPTEHARDIQTDLPPGFIGNPEAVTQKCPTVADVLANACPPGSIVGGVDVHTAGTGFGNKALYAIQAERGAPAEFAFEIGFTWLYTLKGRLRPGDNYALSVDAPQVGKLPELTGIDVTLCGFGTKTTSVVETTFNGCVPNDASAPAPGSCVTGSVLVPTQCSFKWPFLTNPTECSAVAPVTTLSVDSWEQPTVVKGYQAISPKVTGCNAVPFDPSISLQPTSHAAGSPTGLDVSITVPTDGLEQSSGIAQADLKRAVVTLPQGTVVSPSAADGLDSCTPSEISLGTNNEPTCPDAARIGSAEIDSPLLDTPLDGSVYLAQQNDNPFHSLLALYIVAESTERGVIVKLPGRVDLNPATGQLTTTFDNNPQLPFSSLNLHFNAGPRAALMTPASCGSYATTSSLSPWSATPPVTSSDPFAINQNCSAASGFSPSLNAGVTNPVAGSSSAFTFTLSRDAGENISGLDATLPPGLLAKLAGIPLCPEAQATTGVCDPASQIGHATVAVGPGSTPVYIPQPGKAPTAVYLAGPYKGAPYSLVIRVPAQAGPFDLGTVAVRAALFVDPTDAHVTVKSDPLPQILKGIPLEYRKINVVVDRAGFMRAPTSCAPMQMSVNVNGAPLGGPVSVNAQDAGFSTTPAQTAHLTSRFQVADCASLGFTPKLKVALTGKGKTRSGDHPTLTATLSQRSGQANIHTARVALPLSMALDPNNSQHVCSFATAQSVHGGAVGCPASTIVGRATAVTPLLSQPLTGPVYLVQGIRFGKNGQPIHTLPSLLIPLRGQIALDLRAQSAVSRGKLVTTFATIPDAPVSKFTLKITGGRKGILVITGRGKSICGKKQVSNAMFGAQSGKSKRSAIKMSTPCRATKSKKNSKAKKGRPRKKTAGDVLLSPAVARLRGW